MLHEMTMAITPPIVMTPDALDDLLLVLIAFSSGMVTSHFRKPCSDSRFQGLAFCKDCAPSGPFREARLALHGGRHMA